MYKLFHIQISLIKYVSVTASLLKKRTATRTVSIYVSITNKLPVIKV